MKAVILRYLNWVATTAEGTSLREVFFSQDGFFFFSHVQQNAAVTARASADN